MRFGYERLRSARLRHKAESGLAKGGQNAESGGEIWADLEQRDRAICREKRHRESTLKLARSHSHASSSGGVFGDPKNIHLVDYVNRDYG